MGGAGSIQWLTSPRAVLLIVRQTGAQHTEITNVLTTLREMGLSSFPTGEIVELPRPPEPPKTDPPLIEGRACRPPAPTWTGDETWKSAVGVLIDTSSVTYVSCVGQTASDERSPALAAGAYRHAPHVHLFRHGSGALLVASLMWGAGRGSSTRAAPAPQTPQFRGAVSQCLA